LWEAALSMLEGRFDEAARLREQSRALGRQAQDPNAETFIHVQSVVALFEQRRFAEIDLDAILGVADWPAQRPGWGGFVAAVLSELGRHDEARQLFEELAAEDFAALPSGVNWHVVVDVAEACALIADAPRAQVLYHRLLPHAHLFPVTARAVACAGSAEFFLGRLAATAGERVPALAHFERALEANTRIGARPRAALTRWRLAELLAEHDDARATALLEAARADATALSMHRFAGDLPRSGAPSEASPRAALHPVTQLTLTEPIRPARARRSSTEAARREERG
jgi:tetratricopeptide (TPR) repeat protein